jgi:hypothetical protein
VVETAKGMLRLDADVARFVYVRPATVDGTAQAPVSEPAQVAG